VLAKLRAQPGQQDAEAERFGDVIVGVRIETQNGVRIGIRATMLAGRIYPLTG